MSVTGSQPGPDRTLRLQRLGGTGTGPEAATDPAARAARMARLALPSGDPDAYGRFDTLRTSANTPQPTAQPRPPAPETAHRAPRGAHRAAAPMPLGRAPEPPLDLTGRHSELDDLTERVRYHSGLGPALLAITGPDGSGRSSLAYALARRLAEDRPGGILHAQARTARGAQADPGGILARFLTTLGAPPEAIPFAVDDAASALRRQLLRRPAVLVLDDADDPALLDPLVPQAPGSVIIITARNPQPRAHAQARLGPLPPGAAHDLLTRLVGPTRVACDPAGAHALVAACGGQPMALRLVGALLQGRPRWSVADATERVAAAAASAARLRHGEPALRAAFACVYAELSRPAARLFRLLALVPGEEATPELGAALTGSRLAETITACDELRQAALIEPGRHLGRFRVHPLLRHYAATLLVDAERLAEQAQARRRLITWYVDAVHAAAALDRGRAVTSSGRALRPFDDAEGAHAWVLEEDTCLLEAARIATAYGLDVSASRIALPAAGLIERHLPATARMLYETAVRAGKRSGDAGTTSTAWLRLGRLLRRAGHEAQAGRALHTALRLGREHGDDRLVGAAAAALAGSYADDGQTEEALRWYQQSLQLREANREPPAVRAALWSRIGRLHADAARTDEAAAAYEKALALTEECGDEDGRARLLLALAAVADAAGRREQAMRASRGAVAAFHALGDAFLHACALVQLAELLGDVPDPIASGVCRREALAIAAGLPAERALVVERLAAGGTPVPPLLTGSTGG